MGMDNDIFQKFTHEFIPITTIYDQLPNGSSWYECKILYDIRGIINLKLIILMLDIYTNILKGIPKKVCVPRDTLFLNL